MEDNQPLYTLVPKLLVHTLILFLTYVSVDFFVHGILISDYFDSSLSEISGIALTIKLVSLLIGMFWVAVVLAILLYYLPVATRMDYVLTTTILGSLFILPYHLINYAFFTSYPLHFVFVDTLVSLLEFSLVGLSWYYIEGNWFR